MADTIQIRAGYKANMPKLTDRELGYVRDERALYIGTATGNVKLCDADLEGTVTAQGNTIGGLQNTVQSHTNGIASLSSTVQGHGNAIGALNGQMAGKLTATPAAAQGSLDAAADLAAVIAAYNNLIAAMKASGVMTT